jgi:hypothetical protein
MSVILLVAVYERHNAHETYGQEGSLKNSSRLQKPMGRKEISPLIEKREQIPNL